VELEVCIDTLVSAQAAVLGGASRLEVCAALSEGGITPSLAFIKKMPKDVEKRVIIRPRCGDFAYTDDEIELMVADMEAARNWCDGFVFGALTPDGEIDVPKLKQLIAAARGAEGKGKVTFIRSIDIVKDPLKTLDQLIELGVDTVLTSGAEPSAPAGAKLIAEMVRRSQGKISVMAGAGITADNVGALVKATGVKWIHGSCRSVVDGRMRYRKAGIYMGAPPPLTEEKQSNKRKRDEPLEHPVDAATAKTLPFDPEYMFKVADADLIKRIIQNANDT